MDVNNQGLNLPSNLQNLDVRNELLSTEVGSGASCAYSLRDLTGNNLDCVRVRRELQDSTNPDDERKFACQAVQVGELEDWVNGKLEHTLPAEQIAVQVEGGSEVAGKYYSKGVTYATDDIETPVLVYYNDRLTVPLKIIRFKYGSELRWRFERQDNNNPVVDPTNQGTVYESPADVPISDWTGTGNTAITSITKVSNADIAYSLRKANPSYSGNAVRIRRSSDDVEVNVALDSDDKVSTSSSISVVSGSTSATDLNEFLNETLTVGIAVEGGSNLARPDSFTNATNSSFTASVTETAGGYFPYKTATGDVITVSFDIELSGEASPSACTSAGINTVSNASPSILYTSSGSYTSSFTSTADATHFRFADGDDGTFSVTNFRVVSHTHQAFVHTWYDQAGSNNAVQETDANQPKIAENGALLTDGVTFDGTDDFLQTSGQVLSNVYTGGRSLYGVCKINTDSGYIFGDAGSGTNEGTSFYSDTASDKILFTNGKSGTLLDYDNITTIEGSNFLISSNYNNNNTTTIHKNSNNNGYTQGTGTYNFTTSSQFTIGDRQGGSSEATKFNGSIKEIIAYNSDQSDNRFKIESNINNYYGLYNDANEFASDETAFRFLNERSGGTSASSDLTQFTLDVQTSSGYAGAKFSSDVTSGDSIYVSFNASLDEGSFTASPKVGLRDIDSALSGTLYSNEGTVTEGFNSFQLTSTNSVSSGIVWSEGDDNVIFTISDIKVSRIARNGFVETLYDQSGNGDDMTQATAGSQPAIVQNGGQVKLENGKPAFKGDGGNDYLEASFFYSAGEVTAMSTFSVVSNSSDTGEERAIISAGSGFNNTYPGFMTSLDKQSNANPFEQRVNNGTDGKETTVLSVAQDGDILGSTFFTKGGTHLLKATTKDGTSSNSVSITTGALQTHTTKGKLRVGASFTFAVAGEFNFPIAEVIVYRADLRDEGIEDEINNFYNI